METENLSNQSTDTGPSLASLPQTPASTETADHAHEHVEEKRKASKGQADPEKSKDKKKVRIRATIELSENQIKLICSGTVLAESNLKTKNSMLRTIIQNVKADDLHQIVKNACSRSNQPNDEGETKKTS